MSKEHTQRIIHGLEERARKEATVNRKYLLRLKEKNPRDMDVVFSRIHEEVFESIDCMACARCCTILGPRIKERDISRLAKYFNTTPKGFIGRWLRIDEDGDYVFRSLPCPFLDENNFCSVYEHRPAACAEYPHTDCRNMRGYLVTLRKNLSICPAAWEILQKIKQVYSL